jgi:tRNA threonylcarbamoyladenosine biosynthesis protein TsaE
MKFKVTDLKETKDLANDFAAKLNGGEVVLLNGDLGAGKTTFTQFVFAALGVKDVVDSPTFSILKTYQGEDFKLNHFDTYRIGEEEAIEAGFDEVLSDRNCVSFIEWSENISSLLPKKCTTINIKLIDENKREFEIVYE